MIEILYFARLREQLGRDRERLAFPENVGTVAELLAHLRGRGAFGPIAWARARP